MKLKDLPLNSKIKFGKYAVEDEDPQPIIWVIADKNHHEVDEGYPKDACTLITEKMIDDTPFDAAEPNNPNNNRKRYGNNFYPVSNIHQWLNSNKLDWYTSQHEYDQSPVTAFVNPDYRAAYDKRPGFLYYFSNKELNIILDTTIKIAEDREIDMYSEKNLTTKIFLLSNIEVGFDKISNVSEGAPLSIFTDNNSRICQLTEQFYNNMSYGDKPSSLQGSWYWALRTSVHNLMQIYGVAPDGSRYDPMAYYTEGTRLCLNLSNKILVTETPDSDGCYNLILEPQPKYIYFKRGDK